MNNIKSLRAERNINQDVLADLLGLEVAGISKLETGRVPLKDEYIIKLAKFFNVSTDYILGASKIKKNSNGNLALDTQGLGEEDLRELRRHIHYIKRLKGIN